jgi:hypothetical protein
MLSMRLATSQAVSTSRSSSSSACEDFTRAYIHGEEALDCKLRKADVPSRVRGRFCVNRENRNVTSGSPTTREVSHRGSNLVLGFPTASCGHIALICRGSCSLPAAFHQKHTEIRGQRLSVELPHHQCDLTSMVGGRFARCPSSAPI